MFCSPAQASCSVCFGLQTTQIDMLGDLSTVDSDSALRRRLRHYTRPAPLVIDEARDLSYWNRHAGGERYMLSVDQINQR
jgi:hypothetical protein